MTSARYYYADQQNQPVGPFALQDLEKMKRAGVIDPHTQVCPEGGEDWVALESLIAAPPPPPPQSPPPLRASREREHDAKTEKNAIAAAAAAILFPLLMILPTLAVATTPQLFAITRAQGTGFLLFLLFFAIGIFGPINAFKLLRIPGIAGRKPTAVVFAWIGIGVFLLGLCLLLLVGFGLEAEMDRRTG